jgi:uncharacterized delta-60 repeat protein
VRRFLSVCSVLGVAAAVACGNVESSDPAVDAAPPPLDVDAGAVVDAATEDLTDGAPADAFIADAAPGMVALVPPPEPTFVRRSGTGSLVVQVVRGPGVSGPITITATSLPAGVTAAPVVVAEGDDQATLTLRATADATLQQTAVELSATADATAAGSASVPLEVIGLPGSPDTTFGEGGALPVSSYGTLLKAFPVGDKILAVFRRDFTRTIVFVRFLHNGTIDVSYGVNGQVSADIGVPGVTRIDRHFVELQRDGKVLVAGAGPTGTGDDTDTVIARFTSAGTPDVSFAARRIDRAGESLYASAVAVGPSGEIVIAGHKLMSNAQDQFFARLGSDGTPDNGFGTGGVLVRSEFAYDSVGNIVVQIDGRILATVGGNATMEYSGPNSIIRLRTSGEVDQNFAGDGRLAFTELRNPEGIVHVFGLAPGIGDGFFVLGAARSEFFFPGDSAVWSFGIDGAPNSGFGVGGAWIAPETPNYSSVRYLTALEDGSMVTGGTSTLPDLTSFSEFAQISRTGVVVPSFGSGGFALDARFTNTSLTAAPRHRLIASGSPPTGSATQLLRYWR